MKKRNVLIAALLAVMMGSGIFMSCLSTSEVDQKETEVADTTAETYSFYVKVCSIYGVESLTEEARSSYPNLERDVQAYKQNEQEYLVALGQAKGLQELEKAFLETSLTESEKTRIKEKVVSSVKAIIEHYQQGIVNNLNKYSAENEGIDAFELFKQPDQLNMGIRYNMINCFSLDADNLYIWERDFGLTLADFPVLKAAYDAAEEKARELAAEEEKNRKLAEATEAEKRKLAEAAEAKYRELFNKAKEYEEKGQIFYALAYYADALMVRNAANEEAEERFTSIGKLLTWDGLPGVKSKDQFALYNDWISLLEDAEKYWTEYSPFSFRYRLTQGDLNYENQTASYNLYVYADYSEKFDLLMEKILIPAFQKAYKEDWKKIPKNWPEVSIHNEGNTGKYLVNGAALLKINSGSFYNPWTQVFYTTEFDRFFDTVTASNILDYRWARKESDPFVGEKWEELYAYMFYDMKCSIVDDNGEKLLTSKRFLVAPHYGHTTGKYDTPEYVFEGIPQDMMSRIESLELDDPHFVIEGLYLQYGKVDTEKYDRELIKDLKEISIPISNIPVDDSSYYYADDLFELLKDTRIHYSPDK